MKKSSIALLMTSTISMSVQASSFQVGTVKELAIDHQQVTFQLDTTASNLDIRASCLDSSKELNFVIDMSQVGGSALYQAVSSAKQSGSSIAVNGDGVCIGDEFEKVSRLVP